MIDSSSLCPSLSPLEGEDFSLYIHIPYCLQECHYCDFVKFEKSKLPPMEDYFKLLFRELELKKVSPSKRLRSIYFGGGTPSLAPPQFIDKLLSKIKNIYQIRKQDLEITLEINPGTLSKEQINEFLDTGINRFSLGVQTFNEKHLNNCGRLHSKQDSLNDLKLFNDLDLNYSLDLLFGLPSQTLSDLHADLEIIKKFKPKHVSPYNLTLPTKHSFNVDRPSESIELEMMDLICKELNSVGVKRYEVSNFAKKGYESKHNMSYWFDIEYWGLGMGAHSYFKADSEWGTRQWNSASYKQYETSLLPEGSKFIKKEKLKLHESLTDFCHTSLRTIWGLNEEALIHKYSRHMLPKLRERLKVLEEQNLIFYTPRSWKLSEKGYKMPNEVFRQVCFLKEDNLNE